MNLSSRNAPVVFILLVALRCAGSGEGGTRTGLDRHLQEFNQLSGPEQVRIVVDYPLHRRRFLFWRRQADARLTSADSQHAFEEDLLVHSSDASINRALAAEVNSNNVGRAQYAIYLLCLRARFVPESQFPIRQINGFSLSPEGPRGRISPFRPDFEKLGPEAHQSIREAIRSPDARIQTTAKLYTFALLDELSSESTTDLAKRWHEEVLKEGTCLANGEPAQLIFLLKRALAQRGLDAAVAISSLLKTESNPKARYDEIYMLQFLDAASVRLRGSEEGREAISSAKNAWGNELRVCGKPYRDSTVREGSWRLLEDQFLRDKLPCALGDWATLIAVALDEKYQDQLSVPFQEGYRRCGPQMEDFLSHLTDLDPRFPAWEFPSTASQDDMLHPQFWVKVHRYHEAFLRMAKH